MRTSSPRKLTFADATFDILKSARRPMKPKEIANAIIANGLVKTKSKRPEATLNVRLHCDSRFRKVGKGFWELKRS